MPTLPSPKPRASHRPTFCLCELDCSLGTLYKWNHAMFVLLCLLTSCSIVSSRSIHDIARVGISFSLRLTSMSLHVHNHVLFILARVDGRLGCFCLWAVVSGAARMSVWVPAVISSGPKPGSGVAGSYSNSAFNLLRNCHTGFYSSCTIYIPTSNSQGSNLSASSPALNIFCIFDNSHLNGMK